jgi:hypothetical protein
MRPEKDSRYGNGEYVVMLYRAPEGFCGSLAVEISTQGKRHGLYPDARMVEYALHPDLLELPVAPCWAVPQLPTGSES